MKEKGVRMNDISVLFVVIIMTVLLARYAYQVYREEIEPTLSTWIIFVVGAGFSLVTYAVAENRDFYSGILNTMDVIVVVGVLVSILFWGNREIRFKSFEKWYLVCITFVVAYGIISGDAWSSNIFTQVLISIGYIPTIQNLIKEKKNTESFTAWLCAFTAGLLACYPAWIAWENNENVLALLYSSRTVILVSCVLATMAFFRFFYTPKKM
jgi:hypothetical protein